MGKNKRQASGDGRGPNWKPYLAVLGVAIAVAAFFSVPGSSDDASTSSLATPGRSSAEMESELNRLYTGLAAVGGRGGSALFDKINTMANQAKAVLDQARASKSEDERKRILTDGLQSKVQWMATLQDYAVGLKQEGQSASQDRGSAIQASGAVVALTKDNFTNFVATNARTMVEFYTPWCPHCKKFAPEYEACAEGFGKRVAFAMVNGEEERQLTRVYNVGGYPELKWMVHGRAISYEGPRTKEKLAEWIEERLKPAYVDMDSAADAAAALEQGNNKNAKICAGEGTKETRRFQAFIAAAEHFRGKMIFTWSPASAPDGGDGPLRLHASGLPVDTCGAHAGGQPDATACEGADEVIAWLEDRMTLDPDLA